MNLETSVTEVSVSHSSSWTNSDMNDRFEKICVMVEEEQKVLSMIVGGLASRIASIENQAPQANPSDVTTRTVIGLVIPANLSITNIRELSKPVEP